MKYEKYNFKKYLNLLKFLNIVFFPKKITYHCAFMMHLLQLKKNNCLSQKLCAISIPF